MPLLHIWRFLVGAQQPVADRPSETNAVCIGKCATNGWNATARHQHAPRIQFGFERAPPENSLNNDLLYLRRGLRTASTPE